MTTLQAYLGSQNLTNFRPGDEKRTMADPILEDFLEYLLVEIDYSAMGDFFLSYRTYLEPWHLLDFLVIKYQTGCLGVGHKLRQMRIRIFVVLRHWILNYYVDDFLLSRDLQQRMSSFLNSLAGIGADEVSTEDRIAKELRRCWAREQVMYEDFWDRKQFTNNTESSSISLILKFPAKVSPSRSSDLSFQARVIRSAESRPRRHRAILRGNINASKDCHLDSSRQVTVLNNTEALSQTELQWTNKGSDCFDSISEDHLPKGDPSPEDSSLIDVSQSRLYSASFLSKHTSYLPDSPTLKKSTSSTPEKAIPEAPPRTLKRKPGGDLRNAVRLVDLRRSIRCSDESIPQQSRGSDLSVSFDNFEPSLDHKRLSPVSTLEALQDQSVIGLFAKIFQYDDGESSDMDVSQAVSQTLDILEGRTGDSSLTEQGFDPMVCAEIQLLHKLPWYAVSVKKRKHEVVAVAEASNDTHANHCNANSPELSCAPILPSHLSSVSMKNQDLEHISPSEPDNLVTIVEALEMPQTQRLSEHRSPLMLQMSSPEMWLLRQNTAVLSQGLTTIEKGLLREIDWLELVSGSWIDSAPYTMDIVSWREAVMRNRTGVGLVIARFDCVVSWVATLILTSKDAHSRAKLICKFVDVALLCRAYNNFATTMQIFTSLHSQVIRRLHSTWKLVPRDSMKALRSLEGLCDQHDKWHTIRAMQERATINPESIVLPFLGCYLATFFTTINTDDSVIARMRYTAQITKTILEMINRITDDEPFDESLVSHLIWIEGYDLQTLAIRSKICEP